MQQELIFLSLGLHHNNDANDNYLSTNLFDEHVTDEIGRLWYAVDKNGLKTWYQYDLAGNLVKTRQVSGDAKDNTMKEVVTKAKFDSFGNKSYMKDQDAGEYFYKYDEIGNLVSTKIPALEQDYDTLIYMEYDDPLARITHKSVRGFKLCDIADYGCEGFAENETLEDSDVNYIYSYNKTDNAFGKLLSIEDKTGHTRFEYDKYNNVELTEKEIKNPFIQHADEPRMIGTYRIKSKTDREGKLRWMDYNDGQHVINYDYNETGWLTSVFDNKNYKYLNIKLFNKRGQISTMQYGNGLASTYAYYPDGSLENLFTYKAVDSFTGFGFGGFERTYNTYQSYNYDRDKEGNITHINDNSHHDSIYYFGLVFDSAYTNKYYLEYSFDYDVLYRLKSASAVSIRSESNNEPNSYLYDYNHEYIYDGFGNILNKTERFMEGQTDKTYNYKEDTPHRMCNKPDDSSECVMQYDERGNLIKDAEGNVYGYDFENRLISLTGPKGMFLYLYDGTGTRIGVGEYKDFSWQWRYYVGDLMEVNSEGTVDKAHVVAGGRRIASVTPDNNKHFYHVDHLGSTRLITDQDGNAVREYFYDPFGKLTADIEYDYSEYQVMPQGISGLKLGPAIRAYTGQKLDKSGLMYYRARYYNPEIGRFIQPDPFIPNPLFSQSFNRYSYVINNPINRIDPTGYNDRDYEHGGHDRRDRENRDNEQRERHDFEGVVIIGEYDNRDFEDEIGEHDMHNERGLSGYEHNVDGPMCYEFNSGIPDSENRSSFENYNYERTSIVEDSVMNFIYGIGSYWRGIYRTGRFNARLFGLLGEKEKTRAVLENAVFHEIIEQVYSSKEAREIAFNSLKNYVGNNKVFLAGRFGMATATTKVLLMSKTPKAYALGFLLAVSALNGDARYGVEIGLDKVESLAIQALYGNY